MMLPLFIGIFSLPEGQLGRQAAQSYVMHMVSLALWPVAWAVGHTGTIALYNALISLVAGTSRVPEIAAILQWSAITAGAPTEAQVRAIETALGNWFMGNVSALLSILVGGVGFVLWVVIVSILGPAFLHKLLTTGALFMTQAAAAAGRQTAAAGKLALGAAQMSGLGGGRASSLASPQPASACPERKPPRVRRSWREPVSGATGAQRLRWRTRRGRSTIRMARAPPECENPLVALPPIIRSLADGSERLLDRVLCVVGAVLFSQLPEFMQQYLQRLEGHLDEARLAVSRFADAAAKSGMSLDQLVAGASTNPDPSMGRLGGVIRGAVARVGDLAAADDALRHASVWTRPFVFIAHVDAGIARATLAIYKPAVPTTAEGLLYAGLGMVLVLALYHLAVRGPIVRRLQKNLRPARLGHDDGVYTK
jgi:hypothetical protein